MTTQEQRNAILKGTIKDFDTNEKLFFLYETLHTDLSEDELLENAVQRCSVAGGTTGCG